VRMGVTCRFLLFVHEKGLFRPFLWLLILQT
jgi:hypothetical protein